MRVGISVVLGVAAVATAGCASKTGQIEVRALGGPATKPGAGSDRLAEARGQLALGNVGLAIEGFHAALREQPDSIDAMGGLASCYDSMGRADLARQYYEAALAVSPRNPALLNAFAASLQAQGRVGEAMAMRSEAALASQVAATPAPVVAVAAVAPAPTVVVAASPAPPVAVLLAPVPVARPVMPPAPAVATAVAISSKPAIAVAAPVVIPVAAPAPTAVPAAPAVAAPVGQTVTIALPPARPAAAPVGVATVAPPADPAPAALPLAILQTSEPQGPRLQRLSPGEVALLTSDQPVWQPRAVARTAQSVTVRWVALNDSASRPNIRLLNAARSQGLAARTRAFLMARGWRNIAIGDADEVRASSLVMYPEGRQTTGRSLAAQFAFRPDVAKQGEVIVVILGRDAAAARAALARG